MFTFYILCFQGLIYDEGKMTISEKGFFESIVTEINESKWDQSKEN